MHEDNMTNIENSNLIDDYVISDPLVEAQIAHGISDLLNDRAQHLKPEQVERLSSARIAAVNHLAERQAQYNTSHQITNHGVLRWFEHAGHGFDHPRGTSIALVVVVMALTFFAAQQFGTNHNLENSDAFLLASDLPPEAYADKGFDAWIESN